MIWYLLDYAETLSAPTDHLTMLNFKKKVPIPIPAEKPNRTPHVHVSEGAEWGCLSVGMQMTSGKIRRGGLLLLWPLTSQKDTPGSPSNPQVKSPHITVQSKPDYVDKNKCSISVLLKFNWKIKSS